MAKPKFDVAAVLAAEDSREIPTYTIREAAHYLRMPDSTVRAWFFGTSYSVAKGKQRFTPILAPADPDRRLISFFNLAEAHILRSLRVRYKIRMQDIRSALTFVQDRFGWPDPLRKQQFQTDGASLLVEHLGHMIDAGAGGQIVMKELVQAHLERLEWENELVVRLYPFTRVPDQSSPKLVVIDPRFCFGKPAIKSAGIATAIISERYKAGDSVAHLAKDYGCSRSEIEEALRCELNISSAA